MTNEILDYINERGQMVTFAELARNIEGFRGTASFYHEERNIVLWVGISPEGIEAMQSLLDEKLLVFNGTSVITYLNDGVTLSLPIATQIVRPYNRPHWWPVTFSLSAKGQSTFPVVSGEDATYFSDDDCVGKKG